MNSNIKKDIETTHQNKDSFLYYSSIFISIFIINLAAHYILLDDFGLYYDDLFQISILDTMTFDSLLGFIWNCIVTFAQGRPLSNVFIKIHFFVWTATHSINMLYIIALFEQALRGYVVYLILCRHNKMFAFISACLSCLLPAFPLDIYLNNSFCPQFAMLITLIGIYAYTRGRMLTASALLIISILTYEASALLLLAAPFLNQESKPIPYVKKIAFHSVVFSVVFLIIPFFRFITKDQRLVGENKMITIDLVNLAIKIAKGFFVSISSYFNRFEFVYTRMSVSVCLCFSAAATVSFLALLYLSSRNNNLKIEKMMTIKFVLFSFFSLILAYAVVSLKLNPSIETGFGSRVHIAAGLGSGMLVALPLFLLTRFLRIKTPAFLPQAIVSSYIGFLVANGFIIQEKFVDNWITIHESVQVISEKCPDFSKSDVIYIEKMEKENIDPFYDQYIPQSYPAMLYILPRIFEHRMHRTLPLLFIKYENQNIPFTDNIEKILSRSGFQCIENNFYFNPFWLKMLNQNPLEINTIIGLKETSNGFKRISGKVKIKNCEVNIIEPPPKGTGRIKPKNLFDIIMNRKGANK